MSAPGPLPELVCYPPDALHLLEQHTRLRTVVPFIGAGISAPTLPLWWTVVKGVWEEVMPADKAKDFDAACKRLNNDLPVITEVITAK